MSSIATEWAWSRTDITGNLKNVLLALAWWADDEGVTYQPVSAIAERAGLKERATQMALAELVNLNALEVDGNGGRGQWRKYTVKGASPCTVSEVKGAQICTVSEPERVHISDERVHIPAERVHESVKRVHTYAPTNINPIQTQDKPSSGDTTPAEPPKRNRRKDSDDGSRVLTLPDGFNEKMALRFRPWTALRVEALIDNAVNYYLPEIRRGKYQSLPKCVEGSLYRDYVKEFKRDPEPQSKPAERQPATSTLQGSNWERILALDAARKAGQPMGLVPENQLEPLPIRHARNG